MRVLKAEFLEHLLGVQIAGMMTGRQTFYANRLKREVDYGAGGLQRQPPAPILRPQMEPQFMYLVLQPVWPETAAAHMLVARKQMDRPVLKLVSIHPGDFTVQSLADFFVGKRAAEEARHLNIAPKIARQRQVISRPATKSKARAFQKISLGNYAGHEPFVETVECRQCRNGSAAELHDACVTPPMF